MQRDIITLTWRIAAAGVALWLGMAAALAQENTPTPDPASNIPKFRQIDATLVVGNEKDDNIYRFFAVDDFPPFSFTDNTGSLAGVNVQLAAQLCKELRLQCRFEIKAWSELLDAKDIGPRDVVIAGLKQTQASLEHYDFTRPFILPTARFITRRESGLGKPTIRDLAGKRIGVVASTSHAAYLDRYYGRSTIRFFDSFVKAGEALRTGLVDAVFGDAVMQSFWLAGTASRACCRYMDGAFLDRRYFSAVSTMAVQRDNRKLRDIIDYGLDRLQENGMTERILLQFFPVNPWADIEDDGS